MSEVVQLVTSASLQILLTYWIVRRDDRRLTGIASARAFPTATFWIAVVVFGPVSIPIHYVRTRRSWTGLMLGILWFAATVAIIALAGLGIAIFLE
jgi:hypothetical protein